MRLAPAVLSLATQAWRSRVSDVLLSLMLLAMLLYGGLFATANTPFTHLKTGMRLMLEYYNPNGGSYGDERKSNRVWC